MDFKELEKMRLESLYKHIYSNKKTIPIIEEDKYIKDKILGKGRFSVFSGVMKETGQEIAIKEIPIQMAFNEPKALIQEVDMCSLMTHERVPQFFGITITKKSVNLIMELIKNGITLADKVLQVDYKQKIEYMVQLTSIIKSLHKHKIIHRDLKPLNVLVNDKNDVYLIDFGTSKFCNGSSTNTSDVKGTTFFMPPENLDYENLDEEGEEEEEKEEEEEEEEEEVKKPYKISIQFDIWSLGCIISEICSGVKPWTNINWNTFDFSKFKKIKKKNTIDTLLITDFLEYKVDFPIPDELKPELQEILKLTMVTLPKNRIEIDELNQRLSEYYNKI